MAAKLQDSRVTRKCPVSRPDGEKSQDGPAKTLAVSQKGRSEIVKTGPRSLGRRASAERRVPVVHLARPTPTANAGSPEA